MGWIEEKISRWSRKIDEYAGAGVGSKVLEGAQKLVTLSPEERAEWMCEAMERLEELVPDLGTRACIMLERACVLTEEFGNEVIFKLRDIFNTTGDVDKVLDEMRKNSYLFENLERDGNVVYAVKHPRYPDEYKKAKTACEKQRAYCHCALVHAGTRKVAYPYCCCGAGWYKPFWEQITGKPVEVKVVESVMKGDERCRFAILLP